VTDAGITPRAGRVSSGVAHGLLASTRTALGSVARSSQRVEALRAEGVEWFESGGFPSPKDEAWRFTPLAAILRVPYAKESAPKAAVSFTDPFAAVEGPRIVIANGKIVHTTVTPEIDVGTRAAPFADFDALVETHLGRVTWVDDGFDAQNAALFDDVVVIRVKKGAAMATPLFVVHVMGGGELPVLSVPRVLVVAEANSAFTLVQAHVTAAGAKVLESSVTEVAVADGARVEHVRYHAGDAHSAAVARLSVRQAKDSTYLSRVFTFGGALARLTLDVRLEGPGATTALDGLYLSQAGDLLDHHTVIDHASPDCSSRERYKGTLDGNGVGIFDGTVVVRPNASRTAAHQENRNLLLSPDAVVHAKPHLRIDTDDVKCSHGATVGRLDPAHLFYLRSRGIDEGAARTLLTYAFAREVAESVTLPALRQVLDDRIATRLPGGSFAKELA
jgi:Fe-S cluster assembly protein SufD